MKHLVIGAGATLSEALRLGNPRDICPPLISDFARKTWSNYSPHPILEIYLRELGYEKVGDDPRELFYELEESGITNIERFMEFAWANRDREIDVSDPFPPGYISGLRITSPGNSAGSDTGFWRNLLYHGIGSPLSFFMIQCFFENGRGWKDFNLSKEVAARLDAADLVLNLNYDTVFELALMQLGRAFVYSPHRTDGSKLLVCKPHGSLNLVADDQSFAFGQSDWLGMPEPPGYRSYSGLIPPRLNKSYTQHPIAQMILAPVRDRLPQAIIMWGVGLTESDADLVDIYARWSNSATTIEIINPDSKVAAKAQRLFKCEVRHFSSISEWCS